MNSDFYQLSGNWTPVLRFELERELSSHKLRYNWVIISNIYSPKDEFLFTAHPKNIEGVELVAKSIYSLVQKIKLEEKHFNYKQPKSEPEVPRQSFWQRFFNSDRINNAI
jgi:hypothetical protein